MMEKKWLVISLGSVIAVLGLLWLLHQWIRLPGLPADPWEAIPVQAQLIGELELNPDGPDSLPAAPKPVSLSEEEWESWERWRQQLTPDTTGSAESASLTSLLVQGGEGHWLLILDDPQEKWPIRSWFPGDPDKNSMFRGYEVVHLEEWSWTRYRNLWVLGQQAYLVEDALRMLTEYRNEYGQQAPYARRAYRAAGSWWIRREQEAHDWVQWLPPDSAASILHWQQAEGEAASTGTSQVWRLDTLPDLLPKRLDAFWLATMPVWRERSASYGEKRIPDWLPAQGVGGWIRLPDPLSEQSEKNIWIVQRPDPDSLIQRLSQQYGEVASRPYQLFQPRQLAFTLHLPHPVRQELHALESPWMLGIEHFLLIGTDPESMERWIDQYLAGDVLGRETAFLEMGQKLPAAATQWLYGATPSMFPLPAVSAEPHRDNPLLLALSGEKGQWQRARNTIQSRALQVAWRETLEAPVVTPPQWIRTAAGTPLLLVQDGADFLYCFDAWGEFQWKRRLEGRLLGKLHPLDFYQNGERQWIGNTNQAIYIIDERGTFVGAYPLRLQSPMTNPLQLVNFDGRGDYAYFVACANENIYGFDRLGKPLDGWSPLADVGRVILPVGHFQTQLADFLYLLDEQPRLHVFDRAGKPRFDAVAIDGPILAPPAHQVHPASNRIVAGSAQGRLTVVNTEGQSFGLQTRVGDQKWVDFRMVDWWGDDRRDYLVGGGSEVVLYSYRANDFIEIWRQEMPFRIDALFAFREYPEWMGLVNLEKGRVALIHQSGQPAAGFPIAGSTAFDLVPRQDAAGTLLAVGLENQVYVYVLDAVLSGR